MDYKEVEEVRQLPGLKLVLTVGVPGPWGIRRADADGA